MPSPRQDAADQMDGIYRHHRYIYDVSRKFFLLGRDRMLDALRVPQGGGVLEVGCGTGRNLIQAARRYPDAKLYGFDISRAMLDVARRSIARAGLDSSIRVTEGDATGFSSEVLFGVAAFDRVFISYALSMIPAWRQALPAAYAALAAGGELHIVDFGQQAELPAWFRSGLHAWLNRFSVEPRVDLEDELEELAEEVGAKLEFERLYRDYAHRAVIHRPRAG